MNVEAVGWEPKRKTRKIVDAGALKMLTFEHNLRLRIFEDEDDPTQENVKYRFELQLNVKVANASLRRKVGAAVLDFLWLFVGSIKKQWPGIEGTIESFGYSNRPDERKSFKRSQAMKEFRRLVEHRFFSRCVELDRLKDRLLDQLLNPLAAARAFVNASDLNTVATSYLLLKEHQERTESDALSDANYNPIWLDKTDLG